MLKKLSKSILLLSLCYLQIANGQDLSQINPTPSNTPQQKEIVTFHDFQQQLKQNGPRILKRISDNFPRKHYSDFFQHSERFYDLCKFLNNKTERDKLLYAPRMSFLSMQLLTNKLCEKSQIFGAGHDMLSCQKNYLLAVASIVYGLLDKCAQQNQQFERGSITIIDPQHRIYHFLKGYVDFVTQYRMTNCGYERNPQKGYSGHHVNQSPESQFGIDMRWQYDEGCLKLLPCDMTHVLFGKIIHENGVGKEQQLTFFKLEPIGIANFASMVAHGANSTMTIMEPANSAWRREKDYPEGVEDLYKRLMEMSDKEKLSTSTLPIHQMYKDLNAKNPSLADEFKTFCETRGFHHVEVRTGKEAILDFSPLQQ